MANLKAKLVQMISKKKKLAEGFGPIYEKGKIVPKYKGLGSTNEKDIKFNVIKKVIQQKKKITPYKKKSWPNIINLKNLV